MPLIVKQVKKKVKWVKDSNPNKSHSMKKFMWVDIFFFDRKQQRNILIELRSTKEGWGILPQKKTKQQEYKNS